jgi:hypothetical protein
MGREDKAAMLAVSKAQISGQQLIARANQQLTIEHGIKNLDVTRLSSQGKLRVDSLNDLERRVKSMRLELKSIHVPTVVEEISSDLQISNKTQIDSKFSVCSRCQRSILSHLLVAHGAACARLKSDDTVYQGTRPIPFVGKEVQQLIDTFATFVPQPPRNCLVTSKGPSHIEWQWDAPVFDGGLPVIDYEIKYVAKLIEFDKVTKRYVRSTEVCPSLKTSQWCFIEPLSHKGYKMTGLLADTEYTELMIRCANASGWSIWVSMTGIDKTFTKNVEIGVDRMLSVKTEEADAPGPPLFFACTEITSSCIHLVWNAPFYNGGSPIVEYLVHYTIIERKGSATSRNVYSERSNQIKVKVVSSPYEGVTLVLRNIPAESDVVGIKVKAVSKIGLIGEFTPLGKILFEQEMAVEGNDLKGNKKKGKEDGGTNRIHV